MGQCEAIGRAYLTAEPAVRVLVARRKNSKHQTPSTRDQQARVARLLEVITLVGVYGGLLMPLVYARIVIFPFVYLKMLYFQILIGLTFPAWVTLASRDTRYRPRASWLLWALLAWFGAMGLSTAFAANPWRAFFGTQERMTGTFSLLHLFAWYLMAASVLRTGRDWRRLLDVQIGVGVVSACASLIQLVKPSLIGSTEAGEGARLSGLLGNPIYVGAYQAFCVFFVVFLWRDASLRKRIWYAVALLASLSAFMLAGSRGPLLGLVTGLGVSIWVYTAVTGHRKLAWSAAGTGVMAVVGYGLAVGLLRHRPGLEAFWGSHSYLAHFFDFQLDSSRILLWTAAWDGFLARPILGWGQAGYELAFGSVYRPSYHALGMNDEAHNHLLGVLCETGVVGLLPFLGVWAAYFVTVYRAIRGKGLDPVAGAALIGVGFGHVVQCIFAFDTPATLLTTFLAFAVATGAFLSTQAAPEAEVSSGPAFGKWAPPGLVPALMLGVVIVGSVFPAIASIYAKRAASALANGRHDEMLALLVSSERLPTPYHDDQLLVGIRGLLQLAKSKKLDEWDQRKAALSTTHTIAERYFSKNKLHPRLRRPYANMLLALGKTYTSARVLNSAETLFKQNLEDSPRRQRYLMDYARFHAEVGHLNEAEDLLRKAIALDPTIGEPRWELGKFTWHHLKRTEEGAKLMADAGVNMSKFDGATNDFIPTDVTEWQQFAQACSRVGQLDKLRAIVLGVRNLDPREHRSFEAQLGIAKYMEKSGLTSERDQTLKLTLERNPRLASFIAPVLAGKATLAYQQAIIDSSRKAAPGPLADAGTHLTQDAPISLARTP